MRLFMKNEQDNIAFKSSDIREIHTIFAFWRQFEWETIQVHTCSRADERI
jgi:hypothetical protein